MGAFTPSLLEWLGSSKAMALQILPSLLRGYVLSVSPVGTRARLGSRYPSLQLHGVTCWLGILFMCLRNVNGDIPACNKSERNNMKKRRVCTFIFFWEDIYVNIFSTVSHERTWVSTTHRGVLYPNTQPNGSDMGVTYFCRGPCVDLGFHNTHEPLSP